ncbi:salivary gland secretion protein 4-like, partial [Tropilaelaps mercedesae]
LQATSCRPPAAGHQLQATSCRPPAAGHQLQTTSCRPPVAGHQLQATTSRPPAAGHQLQATTGKPPAADYQLQATSCRLPAAGHQGQATSCKPPGTGHQLQLSVKAEQRPPPAEFSASPLTSACGWCPDEWQSHRSLTAIGNRGLSFWLHMRSETRQMGPSDSDDGECATRGWPNCVRVQVESR